MFCQPGEKSFAGGGGEIVFVSWNLSRTSYELYYTTFMAPQTGDTGIEDFIACTAVRWKKFYYSRKRKWKDVFTSSQRLIISIISDSRGSLIIIHTESVLSVKENFANFKRKLIISK